MTKKDVNKTDDFHTKVMKGLKLSYERLIQSKIEKTNRLSLCAMEK